VLYDPGPFEPLSDSGWDDRRVASAVARIVADADRAFDYDRLWPADEEWDSWNTPTPLKSLYVGAAGVVWALDALRRRGHAESRLDLAAVAMRTLEAFRAEPDFMRGVELPATPEAGLLSGESGILCVAWLLEAREETERALLDRVRENAGNEANEVMWGSPGTLLAASAVLARRREERWVEAWRESADALWAARGEDGLWAQRLYGESFRGLGPAHGVVGNVLALLHGGELLGEQRREALVRDTAAALARTAALESGLANWPSAEGREPKELQWCAGAPGVVVSAADYLDEELLLAGAELTWRAGPSGMEKGSSICHGTAGNGYAFLKAFERTGDERWLERARRFAVHALEQVERARERRGRGRYSLWTGDVGVALYATDCLDARTAYPVLDGWD
jgi:lantibiotic modifying enzyme